MKNVNKMFRSSLNQFQHLDYCTKAGSAVALSASLSATLFLLSPPASLQQQEQQHQRKNACMGIIETNLMEKIANKPYLNYHHIPMVVPTSDAPWYYAKKTSSSTSNDDNNNMSRTTTKLIANNNVANTTSLDVLNTVTATNRPKGVPQRLRILTIDVPQFRNVFDRECHVDMTMVYPDGIAPPKRIVKRFVGTNLTDNKEGQQSSNVKQNKKLNKENRQETHTSEAMDIVQKSLVKSLSRCGNNGVILLEASIQDLNPKNLRRRISFRRNNSNNDLSGGSSSDDNESSSAIYAEEIAGGHVDDDSNCYNGEMDAPWNQHAWAEELKLRVSGGTIFDAPMHRSSVLSRLLFGNAYCRTIGDRQGILQWLWRGSYNNKNKQDDEDASPVASNKPHAVIADGEAMQRVPGSLRELVRCCRNADVPLYIVNDPRIWGSDTHADLPATAYALRKTIKNRIIASALRIKEGSTFHRGRRLGKLEANIIHELHEKKNSAKRAIEDAKKSLKRNSKVEDWSELSQKDLVRELVKRKVILETASSTVDASLSYSKSFVSLCKKCVVAQTSKVKAVGSHEGDLGGHANNTNAPIEKTIKKEQAL